MNQIILDTWDIQNGASEILKKIYLSDYNKCILKSYQNEALGDLERFIKHIPNSLNFLFDRRFVRWNKVFKRDSYKCKPRITLYANITKKGNLSLLWKPTGNVRYSHTGKSINDTDFDENHCSFRTGYFERPQCELLFIHNFEYLENDVSRKSSESQISALLIGAACAAMESIREFLKESFEVTTEYWFELDFDNVTICKFDIVNVADRDARKEKEWFDGFQSQYGIKPNEFITIFNGHATAGKASKALKGISINMDWREVRRVAERLKSHHSDALSDEMNVLTP